jgi:hypothetical protein
MSELVEAGKHYSHLDGSVFDVVGLSTFLHGVPSQ